MEKSLEHFASILKEQMDRIANMSTEKTDFSQKETITIGIIDGDGIGPIISAQARRVLEFMLADLVMEGKVEF